MKCERSDAVNKNITEYDAHTSRTIRQQPYNYFTSERNKKKNERIYSDWSVCVSNSLIPYAVASYNESCLCGIRIVAWCVCVRRTSVQLEHFAYFFSHTHLNEFD